VVGGDLILAEPLAQLVSDPLGHPPGVDEHQCGPVAFHVLGDALEDLPHLLRGGHRSELVVRQLQGQVQGALVPDVDDGAPRGTVAVRTVGARSDQEPGDSLDGPLGGRQPDPLRPGHGDVLEALECQGEVRPSLVAGHRVDLVQDQGLHVGEHRPGELRGDQQVQGFGGGDQEVGRMPKHGRAFGGGRVTGPNRHPDVWGVHSELGRDLPDLPKRSFEVLMDVHGQGLQGRDIDDLRALGEERAAFLCPVQAIDADQESGQGLPRAGGRSDQRVPAGGDLGPPARLGRGRPVREAPLEPRPDGPMEGLGHRETLPPVADSPAAPAMRISGRNA